MDVTGLLTPAAIASFLEVLLIDLVLGIENLIAEAGPHAGADLVAASAAGSVR